MTQSNAVWIHDAGGSGLRVADQAQVSVFDHGFTVGDGVFETLKVVDGQPFALTRHLARLERSALRLGLRAPDLTAINAAACDTAKANATNLGDIGRMRITYTSGSGPLGSQRSDAPPTWVIAVATTKPWPTQARLATVPWPRNERGALAGIKSTSYADNALALAHANAQGADEALLTNTLGLVCEGSGSNIFMVQNGRISTPSVESGCLAGVTRELILEWWDVALDDFTLAELLAADEVFITSSTRDIQSVGSIDGNRWPTSNPVTEQLIDLFGKRCGEDLDP